MKLEEVRAYVRVKITIEIPLKQPWSSETSVKDVYQAAVRDVQKFLPSIRCEPQKLPAGTQILGGPEVTQVLVKE